MTSNPYTVNTFLAEFGTRRGRHVARRLGLKGPGAEGMADLLSAYAWNFRASEFEVAPHNVYPAICKKLRIAIESHPQWPNVQPIIKFWK